MFIRKDRRVMKHDKVPFYNTTTSCVQQKHCRQHKKHLPALSTITTSISTYHFIAAAQPTCLATNCFLPTMFPHIEGSNPRPLLCAPHFQNASPRSIDHKELSYSAWTLCISKRRKIHLLSFPLMKVLYSLYPTNFGITVSFVREDRSSLAYRY